MLLLLYLINNKKRLVKQSLLFPYSFNIMKILRFISLLILLILITNSLKAQWVVEGSIPYDSTIGAGSPFIQFMATVDSSCSWIIGGYSDNNLIKNYICKRSERGWKEIKNHNLDTSIRTAILITAKDTSNAWVSTSRGKVAHTTNGGYNWTVQIDLHQNVYFNGLVFSNEFPNIGYTFADGLNWSGIYIFKTTDSGNNWSQQFISIPGYVGCTNSISVVDSTHAWLGLVSQSGN